MPRKTREIPVSGGLLRYALNCAAIQRQKLATVRQRVSSRDVRNRSDEIQISSCGCIVVSVSIARADEAIFAWTYTTDFVAEGPLGV